jgi:hypothetical protein
MRPEDIRRLYASESPATDDEARETAHEARTDSDQARRLLLTMYTLAGEDRVFDQLLQIVIKAGTMQLLAQAAAEDDTFALHMAELILDGMEELARPARGRQGAKKARTA